MCFGCFQIIKIGFGLRQYQWHRCIHPPQFLKIAPTSKPLLSLLMISRQTMSQQNYLFKSVNQFDQLLKDSYKGLFKMSFKLPLFISMFADDECDILDESDGIIGALHLNQQIISTQSSLVQSQYNNHAISYDQRIIKYTSINEQKFDKVIFMKNQPSAVIVIFQYKQLLMGQQETRKVKNNQLLTAQNIPISLKTFGLIIETSKFEKISEKEFVTNKGKQNQFVIKTNQPATQQIIDYEGFVYIYNQDDRKIFTGKVSKMLRQGFGVQFDDKQNIFYRGEFSNDLYHGWGQTLKYQGEFKNGKKDGWGKWSDVSNNIDYEGFFKDDKFDGVGNLNIETNKLNQFMAEDTIIESESKVTQQFTGHWLNGKMNGEGKLSTKYQVYKGCFVEGLYDGEGVLIRDGITKSGKFSKGVFIK